MHRLTVPRAPCPPARTPNSFTPLIGLGAVALHTWGCLYCQHARWWAAPLLAWSVGAFCNMLQFAVCHEICHELAGPLAKPPLVRRPGPLQITTAAL